MIHIEKRPPLKILSSKPSILKKANESYSQNKIKEKSNLKKSNNGLDYNFIDGAIHKDKRLKYVNFIRNAKVKNGNIKNNCMYDSKLTKKNML